MKLYYKIFVLVVGLFLFVGILSCANSKGVVGDGVVQSEGVKASESVVDNVVVNDVVASLGDPVSAGDSLFASLSRGYCFGTCPVYTLEIYESGHAVYTGKANVEMIGEYEGKVSPERVDEIKQTAIKINFFAFDSLYNSYNVQDIPSHTTSIVLNGFRKKVERRSGYPNALLELEAIIEACVQEIKWSEQRK